MLDSEVSVSVEIAMPAPPGLRYVCDDAPAIRRRRAGKGFVYLDARGRRVADAVVLKRIRSLVIPPVRGVPIAIVVMALSPIRLSSAFRGPSPGCPKADLAG